MITVDQADAILHDHTPDFGVETVALADAVGRILREAVAADRCLPPYDRVAMDGIAIDTAAWAAGRRAFRVAGTLRAGEAPLPLPGADACFEVMTGGVLPPGADAVIRVEDIQREGETATIANEVKVKPRQNVHGRGSDHAAGDALLEAGRQLTPPDIAVLASVGKSKVSVGRLPRVAIVSTGDELVEVDREPLPHQIRRSNAHALHAAFGSPYESRIVLAHLADQPRVIHDRLSSLLAEHDLLLLSGGISMGKFDYIPGALAELGVELRFTSLRQRPGKPFCFGLSPDGATVFALPGNPVSSLVCFCRYVRPFLQRALGGTPRLVRAAIEEEVDFSPSLTYFMPVTVTSDSQARLAARAVHLNGSGDFSGLARSHGFVELPAEQVHFPAGTIAPLYLWQS